MLEGLNNVVVDYVCFIVILVLSKLYTLYGKIIIIFDENFFCYTHVFSFVFRFMENLEYENFMYVIFFSCILYL